MADEPGALELHVEVEPDPLEIELLETLIRREASAATGLGGEVELAIFVRDGGHDGCRHRGMDVGRLL